MMQVLSYFPSFFLSLFENIVSPTAYRLLISMVIYYILMTLLETIIIDVFYSKPHTEGPQAYIQPGNMRTGFMRKFC
jgi:uncharacterized protein YhhL (DUF1145 family)